MSKLDHVGKSESNRNLKGKVGAKEILTRDLARRIALMIEQFPDSNIAVTWDNVVRQTKLRFRHEFRRNVLSQKAWDGRRLIAEAFQDAKDIQRRQTHDTAPKYANESRSRLRLVVAKLQSENLALRERLARVRAEQYDEIYSLLDTRTPLNRLVAMRSELDVKPANEPESKTNRETVTSIEKAMADRSRRVAGDSAPGKGEPDHE
ncbi:hypothetical protein [Paraburkholderia caribensis]|nr:hypothetical protein [Paraburkholderia caribensis]